MSTKNDQTILNLQAKVAVKKVEIAKAERPRWITHCSFVFANGPSTNIQVSSKEKLVDIYTLLLEKEHFIRLANEELGLVSELKWDAYKISDWKSDIKARIAQIDVQNKKKELDALEKKLDNLLSNEAKQDKELADIIKSLES